MGRNTRNTEAMTTGPAIDGLEDECKVGKVAKARGGDSLRAFTAGISPPPPPPNSLSLSDRLASYIAPIMHVPRQRQSPLFSLNCGGLHRTGRVNLIYTIVHSVDGGGQSTGRRID